MVQRAEYKFGVEQGIMYESKVSQDGSEFKVVSAILKREEELKSLESITANTYTRSLWVCDIAHALVRLKHYSLAVVEAIQLWRKPQTAPNPFFWEGEKYVLFKTRVNFCTFALTLLSTCSYLIKMFTDMVFLRSSRRVLVLIPFMLHANPLVQFDPDFLQRVSEWSPATRVLLGDANEVPKARLLNAEEVLLDELHRHCLKVTNTGHLEKVTKHSGNNNAQDQSSPMKKHKDDIFDCPMPGAHLFLAHRRHMLTTGSMKAAIELSNEVKELEKNLQTEKDRIGQIEEKIFSLERSLMFAAKEGLTMSISDVTEGNTSLLEQSIASAALQDFLGGKRLRENKTEHKKLCERLEMLKIELELRSEDASNQRERWNVKQKEDKEKKRRAKERRLKELERMGIRMSKGKAHPSLNEQMTVAKQKAKFDALSLATKNSKSPPKQPRVTFNLEDTKSIEQKQPKKVGEGTKRTSTPQQKHTENDTNSRPAPVQETPMEESQLKKPTINFEDNSTMNTSLESNNMSGSLKESDIQHAKDIENVFLTAPNPIEASKLIKASPKNPFEKPKKSKVMDKTRSPKKQNNSSVLRSPKKKAQVGNMAVPVDLSAVDVHLFDNEIWKTVSGFLNPVERERFRQTNKDVFGYIENAVGKSFLVHDSIHYLQDKIDAKSVEARTSLDSIREISRDVQNLTDKDIKLLYLEAGKHDRVAKNVVDILILLGVTVSSTELLDATEVCNYLYRLYHTMKIFLTSVHFNLLH